MRKLNLSLTLIFLVLGFQSVQAGQCYQAFQASKKLEKIVQDVYFVSESDDTWTAFASWEPVKEISAEEIRRVLKLGEVPHWQETFFKMDGQSVAYKFIRDEIEAYNEENYNEPETQLKLKNLIKTISKKYGKNVRLVLHGNGDGDAYFVGYHMIVIIDSNGCVLGLKAYTVWT